MARFVGKIGFQTQKEVSPDVWKSVVVERDYTGDIIRDSSSSSHSGAINDTVRLSNIISILYRYQPGYGINEILYVSMHGAKWEVTSRELVDNRLRLTLGGVWNG